VSALDVIMRLLGCRGGWFCRSITLGVMTFNVVDPLHRFWSHSIEIIEDPSRTPSNAAAGG